MELVKKIAEEIKALTGIDYEIEEDETEDGLELNDLIMNVGENTLGVRFVEGYGTAEFTVIDAKGPRFMVVSHKEIVSTVLKYFSKRE